ncbi:LPS export ABC transporter periplasmic protein LptC [Telluribacter sp.]|jgi:LPS export ABC transporter protein LptC|uniref:LPS export ABC transporter periplasmic protein LptC n=1 Tax=Telluribacter sp. TaxID=1978767 RepID=UPI002E1249C9|nr:LPS export ABC transporter periplasmic protein LptC [Telluribacter sp.]
MSDSIKIKPGLKAGGKYLSPVFFVLLSLLFVACEDDKNKASIPYTGPIEEVNDVRVLYSENGFLKVEMKTPKQYRFQNEDKVFPDTVNINFFDDTGSTVTTTLRSDSGRYDNTKSLYVVKGNVRVVNSQTQERLSTSELYWNPNTKKVYTDKEVTIEKRKTGDIVKGIGLDAEQDFSQTSIRKPTGIFSIDGAY